VKRGVVEGEEEEEEEEVSQLRKIQLTSIFFNSEHLVLRRYVVACC
jgi:hypothetical protein